MKTFTLLLFSALFLARPSVIRASTIYVDSIHGNDANSGTSPSTPWKTLAKVNATNYNPGDHILFRAGSAWEGQLAISSSGKEGKPIIVDRYGRGSRPRIDGAGNVEDVILLQNVEQVEVHNLEVTNHGAEPAVRRAVLVSVVNYGTVHHIVVADLYIHDVNGTNAKKETGGILFRTIGQTVPSRFDDLIIERNILWKVDRSAIVGQSSETARSKWYPSLHVVIRDNYADDVGGDGIVPWATDGALIEDNIVCTLTSARAAITQESGHGVRTIHSSSSMRPHSHIRRVMVKALTLTTIPETLTSFTTTVMTMKAGSCLSARLANAIRLKTLATSGR